MPCWDTFKEQQKQKTNKIIMNEKINIWNSKENLRCICII